MRKGLLILAVAVLAMLQTAWAYDFSATSPSGHTLYYEIISGTTNVGVVRPGTTSTYYNYVSGNVVIPATVTYNGTTYNVTGLHSIYNDFGSDYGSFEGCSGLTSVTIPNSVTSIGSSAFSGCTSLTSVTIPNSVTSIGRFAFRDCSGLTTLNFNAINCWGYFDIGSPHPFYNCPITTINIGDSVQRIPAYFAYNLESLTSVTIPNSVTSIESSAFYGCDGLTSVTIGNSVTSIENYAFYDCRGLTSVTIPNSVTSIGSFAFYNVRHIIYNGTATGSPWGALSVNGYIEGDFVYANNTKTSLLSYIGTSTSVTIPNSVTSIGNYAFYGCDGLTSVTIGNSVTTIGKGAFNGCRSLNILNFNAINCSNFTYDSFFDAYPPFYNCPISTVTIGDSVQHIPAYFAYNLDSLLSVIIPNSVTTIGKSAFTDCGHLASATISSGINRIEEFTFENCTSLVTITIPSNVANIEDKAFNGCSSLHEVISLAVLPPSLGEEIFSATAILKVPCGSADYYNSAASGWTQYFVGIEEICNVTITVTSANENMGTVSGDGEYEFGEEVTITAIPNEGYRFVSWNDGNTDNPRTITVTEDATYIASFEEGVGIESRDMLSELTFYPNPTSGIITLSRTDVMKVEVIDAVGKTIMVVANNHVLDLSKLTKGYYTLRITLPEGVAIRKVIRK